MSTSTPSDSSTLAPKLAELHDAPTLAQALVLRLRADGSADLAAAIAAACGNLIPIPPDPHR